MGRLPRGVCRLMLALGMVSQAQATETCQLQGRWWQSGQAVTADAVLNLAAQRPVVLLGERHDAMEHHRWQLHTLAGLYAHESDMVIGLEMLPREAQPVLERWVAGELSEEEFLEQSDWQEAWGFDPELYWPILHFARLNRIPLKALNITPALRQRLTSEEIGHIPPEQRYGIPAPRPANDTYQTYLEEVFDQHAMGQDNPDMLERFIRAQLSWDIAMAQGLADATQESTLAVGLMGLGHVVHGHGVAHQLEGLGIQDTLSLLPWELEECALPDPTLSDAIFIVPTPLTTSSPAANGP